MYIKLLIYFFGLLTFFGGGTKDHATTASEVICGRWITTENNLMIQVYHEGNDYKAKIIWFNDGDDPSLMDTWTDQRNPDKSLRNRKILGMSVLRNLAYDASTKSWEDGLIYDAKHGREWNACASINKKGLLEVKGYWHFKWIGRTLTFKRATLLPEAQTLALKYSYNNPTRANR